MNRQLKEFLKKKVGYGVFRTGQRFGLDILPRHFYSEIPDHRRLAEQSAWKRPFQAPVTGWGDLDQQLAFAADVLGTTGRDVETLHRQACDMAGEVGFGPVEVAALHSFVTRARPPAIVQVGCGVSTATILLAAQEAGYQPEITCIEPFPSTFLAESSSSGLIALWRRPAQDVLGEVAEKVHSLPEGALFFVDSTHTLGPAGECTRLICEVLPRLRAGRYAHFHDIVFPFDYSPNLLRGGLFFWHESALLMAFLSCNQRFELAASLSMLHHQRPEQLRRLFPGYVLRKFDAGLALDEGHFPSSCYLHCSADPEA
jgi:hypothetical protein